MWLTFWDDNWIGVNFGTTSTHSIPGWDIYLCVQFIQGILPLYIMHCNTSCKSLKPHGSYHVFLTQLNGDSIFHTVCKTRPWIIVHWIITIPWVYFMLVIIFFKGTAGLFSSDWKWILQECIPGWEKCLIALILKLEVYKTIYDLKNGFNVFGNGLRKENINIALISMWVLDQLCVRKE